MIKNSRARIFFLSLTLLFAGCSLFESSKASDTGFLPDADKLKPLPERDPFQGVWFADRDAFYALKKTRHTIFIAPVDTSYLEAKIKVSDIPDKEDRVEDVREMAHYLRERFEREMKKYPPEVVQVVDEPAPNSFVLELALVELNPTMAALNVFGTAASVIFPPAGAVTLAGHGSVAIEGIVRDSDTDQILVEFKDRRVDKTTIFSFRDFSEYSHSREVMDTWAKEFAELAATQSEHKVSRPWSFTLNPF